MFLQVLVDKTHTPGLRESTSETTFCTMNPLFFLEL